MKITERLKAEDGDELVEQDASSVVLSATMDAIAVAEEEHAQVEERLLFGMLVKPMGLDHPVLHTLRADHSRVEHLVGRIRSGVFDRETVRAYERSLREHIERETHLLFPLVEELVSEDRLASLGNWDEEHVVRAVRRPPAAERSLG